MIWNTHHRPDTPLAASRRKSGWFIGGLVLLIAAGAGWVVLRTSRAPEGGIAPQTEATVGEQVRTDTSAAQPEPQRPVPTASSPLDTRGRRDHNAGPALAAGDDLQKVQMALAGGTPQEALDAARILAGCTGADAAVSAMYAARDQPTAEIRRVNQAIGARPEQVIDFAQRRQRHCQVFDAALLERRGELLQRAHDGGADGAALDYLRWLTRNGKSDIDPALISKLQGEARQSAEGGDTATLMAYAFVFDPSELGVSATQRQAYKEAWLRIQAEQPGGSKLEALFNTSIDAIERMLGTTTLTTQQQREADTLAQQVFETYHHRSKQD